MYKHCDTCKGLHDCNQAKVGYYDGERCKYNLRGTYNNPIILEDRYKSFNCDNWDEIKAHVNETHNLYLWGKYGKGKTHALHYMANLYNERGHNVYVNLAAQISRLLKDEIQFKKSTGESMVGETNRMKEVQILFLDDLGTEKMTDFVHECLQTVIDYRYLHKKPTFISSNYSIDELFAHYSKSIGTHKAGQLCSRLKSFGPIEIQGKNWRKNA